MEQLFAGVRESQLFTVAARRIEAALQPLAIRENTHHSTNRWLAHAEPRGKSPLRIRPLKPDHVQRQKARVGDVGLGAQQPVGCQIESTRQAVQIATEGPVHPAMLAH